MSGCNVHPVDRIDWIDVDVDVDSSANLEVSVPKTSLIILW